MKVRALMPFEDMKEHRDRRQGEVFTVSKERFQQINSTNFGVLVELVEDDKEDVPTPETEKPVIEERKAQQASNKRASRYNKK